MQCSVRPMQRYKCNVEMVFSGQRLQWFGTPGTVCYHYLHAGPTLRHEEAITSSLPVKMA